MANRFGRQQKRKLKDRIKELENIRYRAIFTYENYSNPEKNTENMVVFSPDQVTIRVQVLGNATGTGKTSLSMERL